MKRSRMPDRTGEIARTSPLRTKTPLERTSRLRSSGQEMREMENWRPIVGLEGRYEISDQGRARALYTRGRCIAGRFLTTQPNSNGYLRMKLTNEQGARVTRFVHHLVIEAFVGPRKGAEEVRHLDGNKFNNHPSNLVWGTRSENVQDRVRHGTHHHARKTHCPRGHPYDGHNLILRKATGARVCRECRNARIRARGARRRDTGPTKAVRVMVKERARYGCEMCQHSGMDVHHRRPRALGGSSNPTTNLPSNLVYLCRECHLWIESNRERAMADGWLVPQGTDPASVPVLIAGCPGFAWLTNDGQYLDMQPSSLSDYQQKGA